MPILASRHYCLVHDHIYTAPCPAVGGHDWGYQWRDGQPAIYGVPLHSAAILVPVAPSIENQLWELIRSMDHCEP